MDGVDVVVVNYRTPEYLQRFLDSFDKYRPQIDCDLHVVHVDPTAEDLAVHHDEAHEVIFPYNCGYARAVNDVGASGNRSVIAAFNADTELRENVIDECYETLSTHTLWAIVGPLQVDEHNRVVHAGIIGTLEAPKHRGWRTVDNGKYVDVQKAVTVAGSAFFMKRAIWEELTECPLYQEIAPGALGPFLPTPHYFEETWAAYHAQSHGYEVYYYGFVKMMHAWHKSSPVGGYAEQQYRISRSMFVEACEHHQIPHD